MLGAGIAAISVRIESETTFCQELDVISDGLINHSNQFADANSQTEIKLDQVTAADQIIRFLLWQALIVAYAPKKV